MGIKYDAPAGEWAEGDPLDDSAEYATEDEEAAARLERERLERRRRYRWVLCTDTDYTDMTDHALEAWRAALEAYVCAVRLQREWLPPDLNQRVGRLMAEHDTKEIAIVRDTPLRIKW